MVVSFVLLGHFCEIRLIVQVFGLHAKTFLWSLLFTLFSIFSIFFVDLSFDLVKNPDEVFFILKGNAVF